MNCSLKFVLNDERILRGIQSPPPRLAPEQENDLILCCALEFCMAKVPA